MANEPAPQNDSDKGESDAPKSKAQKRKVQGSRTGQVFMTTVVATSFVSVGIWIAQTFFKIDVPAHLAPSLAVIVIWLADFGKVIAYAIGGIFILLFKLIFE
jgi:hypothetical protein